MLSQDLGMEALYELANEIDDAIAGGQPLLEVANEHKIKITNIEKIDSNGINKAGDKPGSKLPLYNKILETGFKLGNGYKNTYATVHMNSKVKLWN